MSEKSPLIIDLCEKEKSPKKIKHNLVLDVITKVEIPTKSNSKKNKKPKNQKSKKSSSIFSKINDSESDFKSDSELESDKFKTKKSNKMKGPLSNKDLKSKTESVSNIEDMQLEQSVDLEDYEPVVVYGKNEETQIKIKEADTISVVTPLETLKSTNKKVLKPGNKISDDDEKNEKKVANINDEKQMEKITMKIINELIGDHKLEMNSTIITDKTDMVTSRQNNFKNFINNEKSLKIEELYSIKDGKSENLQSKFESEESEQSKVNSNELVEVTSQATSNWKTSIDQIEYDITLGEQYQINKENYMDVSNYDNINKNIITPTDFNSINDVLLYQKEKNHAHVDVFVENQMEHLCNYQPMQKSKHDTVLQSKNVGCSLSACILTPRKPCRSTKFLHKDRLQLGYSMKNAYKNKGSPNIYRSNELLLHSSKIMQPNNNTRMTKNNDNRNMYLNRKTNKNSFWCLPYRNRSKSLDKEKIPVTFSYRSTCVDCQGKSMQTFQLFPKSPFDESMSTPEIATKEFDSQPYVYYENTEREYGDNTAFSVIQCKDNRNQNRINNILSLNKKRQDIELLQQNIYPFDVKQQIINKNVFKENTQPQIFEIQDWSDGEKANENYSIYLEIENRSKSQALKVNFPLVTKEIIKQDDRNNFTKDNTILFFSRLPKESNLTKNQDKIQINIIEDEKVKDTITFSKSTKVSEIDYQNEKNILSKYEAIVFHSDTRLSNNESDKILCDFIDSEEKTAILHDEKEGRQKLYFEQKEQKGKLKFIKNDSEEFNNEPDIKDIMERSLRFTTKDSINATLEDSNKEGYTKRSKPELEYFDTVDMDNMNQETYSLYNYHKRILQSRPKVIDSEITDNYYHSTKNLPNNFKNIPDYNLCKGDPINYETFCFPKIPKESLSLTFEESYKINVVNNEKFGQGFNNSDNVKHFNIKVPEKETLTKFNNNIMSGSENIKHFNTSNISELVNKVKDQKSNQSPSAVTVTDVKEKLNEIAETSSEINTDRQILKESTNALKIKENLLKDPDDFLISSFEPITYNKQLSPEESQNVVVKELSFEKKDSFNKTTKLSDESFLKEKKKKNLFSLISENQSTSEVKFSEKLGLSVTTQNAIPFEIISPLSDTQKPSEIKEDCVPIMFEMISIAILDEFFTDYIERILMYQECVPKPVETESREEYMSQNEIKQFSNKPNNSSMQLCCYFCQRQIPQHAYKEHIKWCTKTQKDLIIQNKLGKNGKNEKMIKDKPLLSLPGTICFICGCYYTKHSILIHEVACRKKWIKWNEQLPKSQRKSVPQKPLISDEMIRENYQQEQRRGNNKFKLEDAVNKLIYESRNKNNNDFDM